ncbi:hypothetical protein D3C76_819870 [compost metagenome]
MLADVIAVNGDNFARLSREVAPQKFAEFALADKADAGGVFFLRGDQIQFFGDFTHFWFFQLTDREQALCNLFVTEGVEEIALIFIAVETAQQLAFAIDIRAAHVVTGRDVICAQVFSGEFEEGFEFDLFVAEDIRVWGAARFVLFQEEFEHVVPVLGSKVNGMQFNAEFVAHGLRICKIRCRRTVFLAIIFLPVLHEQAFHLIALLLQQVRGNGGIDTAGHADDHFFLAVI